MASPLSGQIHYNQLKNSIVMINKLRPHAAQLLVALKKTIPAVILLGSLSLATTPVAQAQITFSVDSFTTDELVLTLTGGSVLSGIVLDSNFLFLVDADGSNTGWFVNNYLTELASMSTADVSLGTRLLTSGFIVDHYPGDYLQIIGENQFLSGTSLSNNLTFSVSAPGHFVPSSVANFALYWGDPVGGDFALQSAGLAATGGGSAVPEPSSYGILLGLAALCFCGSRRRASLQRVA